MHNSKYVAIFYSLVLPPPLTLFPPSDVLPLPGGTDYLFPLFISPPVNTCRGQWDGVETVRVRDLFGEMFEYFFTPRRDRDIGSIDFGPSVVSTCTVHRVQCHFANCISGRHRRIFLSNSRR